MTTGKVLLVLLTGFAIGAMMGILFAPDKGSTTRKKISKKGNEFGEKVEEKFNEFIDNVNEKVESVKEEAARVTKFGKHKAEEVDAEVTHVVNRQME